MGRDFADVFLEDGPEAIMAAADAAPIYRPAAPGAKRRWTTAADIGPRLETSDFVEGLLTDGGLSALIGAPGAGKSTLALGLGLSVAAGRPWHGLAVERGPAAYVALEGTLNNRLAAHVNHMGLRKDVPFAVVAPPLDLLNASSVDDLLSALNEIECEVGSRLRLVVIDTLARAMAGGDENSAGDMGRAVAALDRIRADTGAHVLAVHHLGKDGTRGARGSSALLAALDTELTASAKEGRGVLRSTKQRDLELAQPLAYRLESVLLGTDARAKAVTAAVAVPDDRGVHGCLEVTGIARMALETLRECIAAFGADLPAGHGFPSRTCPGVRVDTWKESCLAGPVGAADNADTASKRFRRARDTLLTSRKIMINRDWVWIVQD